MLNSIKEQINELRELVKSPTSLERLFDEIPDLIHLNGKDYNLHIIPCKGGITFVRYEAIDNPNDKPLIHVESITGIYDALVKAIEALAEKVS